MQNLDSLPVIIGVGDITDRPEKGQSGHEPMRLIEQAARLADQDAGGGWLAKVDQLYVVPQLTWPYEDLPGLVSETLGIKPMVIPTEGISGDSPVRYLMQAAVAIANGATGTVMICGAEAFGSVKAAAMQRKQPDGWTKVLKAAPMLDGSAYVTKLAARYGLKDPTEVYTLYENATRAAWGKSATEAQNESAELWARYAEVAADNPLAWDRKGHSAAEIATPTSKNRPISYPYPKRMVAQLFVNQGAALIVTSRGAALAAGVPEDKLIYVWSGAGATDIDDFLSRPDFSSCLPMATALQRTLAVNGLQASDLDAMEIYSCFPCIPKLALRALGPVRNEVAPSVTGGLSFFGGPLGDFMSHAITAMVRKLRAGDANTGLLYGNGGYVTKHHAAVLATRPPAKPPQDIDLQAEVDAARGLAPAVLDSYEGPATVESYLVKYDGGGDPQLATIVARTPDGARTVAAIPAGDLRAQALLIEGSREPIGLPGSIALVDGQMRWSFEAADLPPVGAPGSPVLLERRDGYVAVVTLNRPLRMNAVNARLARAVAEIIKVTEADPEIRVVVFASSRPEVFCAGLDLSAMSNPRALQELMAVEGGFAGFVNAVRRKPWIAAVRGQALGGGFELALACELIVAADDSKFGLPEVKRGIIAAAGGVARLPRVLPRNLAAQAILTGEPMAAELLHRHGVINALAPADEVIERAVELARSIAVNAPLAIGESIKLLKSCIDESDAELSRLSMEAGGRLMMSADAREGGQAFMEKRAPVWKGK
ncbi:enoyl-CoA hydratase-related protein [Nevskia ramosa]|uniref:enoyl-CoA hydratase-related protein n=1 Tax=Nevskia ramosa TaxID=64002 RepID=UPI0003B4677F|nr:enoyl-CoA hydratase-related protein [Nevskia ramosa]